MLDKESMETYRNIRLNRDLRCEILQRHEKHSRTSRMHMLRPAAALASVALIAGILLLRPASFPAVITFGGETIGTKAEIVSTESVSYAGGVMRLALNPEQTTPLQLAEECIAMEISAGQDVFITVSGGMLLLPDPDGIPTFAGQSGPAGSGASVYLSLAGCDPSVPITLTVSDAEGTAIGVFTITYHTGNHAWQIAAGKTEKNK